MNLIFWLILTVSTVILTFLNPNAVIEAFSNSSNKAIKLSISLLSAYSVWLGFINLIESSGLTDKLSKPLKPVIKFLFKTTNPSAVKQLSLNLSANLLGVGGVATPSGVNAMQILDGEGNEFGKTMLLVITCTSIQIFPLTVISLMFEYGALNPYSIFLPTLITTIISTVTGVVLTFIFR